MFVTSSQDMSIKLWNFHGNFLKVMLGHTSPIDTLAINEAIIVSGCETSIRYFQGYFRGNSKGMG